MGIHVFVRITSLITSSVALLTGWRYYYRFGRNSNQWGWLIMMIGLLSITAAEVSDTYSTFNLNKISELSDFFGMFSEILLTIGFVRLFNHELTREKIRQQSLVKNLTDMENLRSAEMEIASSLNMDVMLQALLRRAMTLSGANLAAIYLYKDVSGLSDKYYVAQYSSEKVVISTREPGKFTRQILSSNRPLEPDDLKEMAEEVSANSLETFGSFPLQGHGNILGVLFVGFKQPFALNDNLKLLLTNITEHGALAFLNALLYKQVETLSLTDTLTGLSNRRSFDQILEKEWERACRYDEPLSLVILDIDHFKSVNDTWGHTTGDFILKQVGDILLQSTRAGDFTARIGGEEFAIILPYTNPVQAGEIVDRLRITIQDKSFMWEKDSICLTCSFGVAGGTGMSLIESPSRLYQMADEALYIAKSKRNCVVIS